MNHEASVHKTGHLMSLLAVSDKPDNDLATLDNNRAAGSCAWFTKSKTFVNWSQERHVKTPILWLSGNAACGKSTICSSVIRTLQEQKRHCYYFFFKQDCAGKSTTAECLRSLAYQLACHSEPVRSKILCLESQDLIPDREDDRTLWRKLFEDCLSKDMLPESQHWVIDALDECQNPQKFLRLMSNLPGNVRIMISSRVTKDIEPGFFDLKDLVLHQQLTPSDTEVDIRLFVNSYMDRLPAVSQDGEAELTNRIMAKSSGSFLWVRLVMQELESAYSKESIDSVLNEIPTGMTELYERMLQRLAINRGTKLAQSILTWVSCAPRALSLEELQMAIKWDINETLSNPEKSIRSICDQFLTLDHGLRVNLVHETAREYLLHQELVPELLVRRRSGNTRLANACLKILSGDWFGRQCQEQRRPSYAQRLKSMDRSKSPRPNLSSLEDAFAKYACFHFSDHVSKASPDSELLGLLGSFLNDNALYFIEYMARQGELSALVRTSINLRRFLERHARQLPPIDWRISSVEAWSTDLIRVTARFRAQLLVSPACIHSLVPAFCPSESLISKARTLQYQGFVVAGLQSTDWDDCVTRIDFDGAKPNAIAYGESSLAIGLSDGRVCSYSDVSLQQQHVMDGGPRERIKILKYSSGDRHLLVAGVRTIRLWDTESCQVSWSHRCPHQILAVSFMEDDEFVNIALQSNTIVTFRTLDGVEASRLDLIGNLNRDAVDSKSWAPPSFMEFSSDSSLLAVGCRGQPVRLFDVNDEEFSLECRRDSISASACTVHYWVDAMVFNPNPRIPVLIVSFGDGELDVFSLWSGSMVCKIPAAFAHNIACAPDGKCLVTASAQGCIQIYDFGGISGDQLSLSYQIDANDPGIRALAFATSSLRFIDIRASQCRVWEPDFLVRRDGDGSSQSDITHLIPDRVKHKGVLEHSGDSEISAICCHSSGHTVFCGTRDGSIHSYDTVNAKCTGLLYKSTSNISVIAITVLSVHEITTLISADEASYLSFRQIIEDPDGQWMVVKSNEARTNEPVAQLLVDASGDQVFVASTQAVSLWSFSGEQFFHLSLFLPQSVFPHPTKPQHLIDLRYNGSARVLSWTNVEAVADGESALETLRKFPSNSTAHASQRITTATTSSVSNRFFTVLLRKYLAPHHPASSTRLLECWPASALEPGDSKLLSAPLPSFDQLGSHIEQLVAIAGSSTLLFLDTELWLCSMDLAATPAPGPASWKAVVRRHFFVPSEWRGAATGTVLLAFSERRREVIAAVGSGVVIMKRGLEVVAKTNWEGTKGKREGKFLNG